MSAGFLGFVLGAALAIALAEVGVLRRRQAAANGGWPRDRHPTNWDATMPPPCSSLRPRWESSSDPADEDDLIEFLLTVAIVVLLAAGLFVGASSLARFLTFLICGLSLGAAAAAAHAWWSKRELPPGAPHVVVRAAIISLLAALALHWFERTRFRGLTFDEIHRAVMRVKLTRRPGEVHSAFSTDGVLLDASLALGVMLAIGLLLTMLVDVTAMLAATRLGEGSRRAFDGWLAQLYPRRQLRLWVSTTLVGIAALLLVGGAVIGWYDRYEHDNDVRPATVPVVVNPPGSIVPLTVPPTTSAITTASSVPATQPAVAPAEPTTAAP